ncbi:MAG: hypothetical protein CL992_01700 [Euryarchaeota archaeon]|nr:hypothetical protein [Euryarchaeota archaeon]
MDEVVASALRYAHGLSHEMDVATPILSPTRVGRAPPHPLLVSDSDGTPRAIWLIGHSMEQMGSLEFERWIVDAGQGPHLLLHLNRLELRGLPEENRIEHLCVDDVARFLGHMVLQGWTPPESAVTPAVTVSDHRTDDALVPRMDVYVLRPRIDAQDWVEERGVSTTLRPVLRRCQVLIIAGRLIGPGNEAEPFEQILLDPGIHAPLGTIEKEHLMEWTPRLDEVDAGSQRNDDRLHEEMIDTLSIRRVMPTTSGEETARVLRWWRPDIKAMQIDEAWALLPAWEVNVPGMPRSILCGWSGVVLTIN